MPEVPFLNFPVGDIDGFERLSDETHRPLGCLPNLERSSFNHLEHDNHIASGILGWQEFKFQRLPKNKKQERVRSQKSIRFRFLFSVFWWKISLSTETRWWMLPSSRSINREMLQFRLLKLHHLNIKCSSAQFMFKWWSFDKRNCNISMLIDLEDGSIHHLVSVDRDIFHQKTENKKRNRIDFWARTLSCFLFFGNLWNLNSCHPSMPDAIWLSCSRWLKVDLFKLGRQPRGRWVSSLERSNPSISPTGKSRNGTSGIYQGSKKKERRRRWRH